MGKKDKNDLDATVVADSASDLAQQFLDDLAAEGKAGVSTEAFEKTKLASKRSFKKRFHPIAAAVAGFLIWGGGFLYLRRWGVFLALFPLLALLIAIYLSIAGMLPPWFAAGVLEGIRWKGSQAIGLALFGANLVVIWWLSIVFPIQRALWTLPFSFRPTLHWSLLFLTAPIPIFGSYVRGHMRRGHFDLACLLSLGIASVGLVSLWKTVHSMVPAEIAVIEPYLLGFLGAALLGVFGLMLGIIGRFLGALKKLGDGKEEEGKKPAGWKLVALTLVIMIGVVVYALVGMPGRTVREELKNRAVTIEEKGFRRSSAYAKQFVWIWEEKILSLSHWF